MIQIEELGKMIAQIVFNRNNNMSGKNPELIQTIFRSLKIEPERLMTASLEDIRYFLDCEDGAGLYRMELAAKNLLEASYQEPEKGQALLERAREILRYVQQHDITFSLERVELLERIDRILSPR